jgi:hypothetical protein
MIDELDKLNSQFYRLYGDLHGNKEFLTEEQAIYIGKALFDAYKSEYELLKIRDEITKRSEMYNLNLEYVGKVPKRRLWLFPNRAAKIAEEAAERELEEYFAEKQYEQEEEDESGVTPT